MRLSGRILIFVVIIFVLILLVGSGWFFLTSNKIANIPIVMKFRQNYYSVLLPKLGISLKTMPFSIMPLLEVKGEPGYVYTMLGKFVRIDPENLIAYIQTKDGSVYGFRYPVMIPRSFNYKEVVDGKIVNQKFENIPLEVGTPILVQWSDIRKLDEVLFEAKNDSRYSSINPYIKESDLLMVIKLK